MENPHDPQFWKNRLKAIARSHGFDIHDLRVPCCRDPHCLARLECYRFLRGRNWSLPSIGAYFNRDHTTILYALTHADRLEKRCAYLVAANALRAQYGRAA